jgi:hypothetical protein
MLNVAIIPWLVSIMVGWAPPEQTARGPWPELRNETLAETEARYGALALAAYEVARANPPLFKESTDGRSRTRTALLLLSLAYFESRFHNRVTTLKGKDRKRSDFGKSWCAVQILLGRPGQPLPEHYVNAVPERWSGAELEADPAKCLTVGYRLAARSLAKGSLSGYTGESCRSEKGCPKARHRLDWATKVVLPPAHEYEDFGRYDDPTALW